MNRNPRRASDIQHQPPPIVSAPTSDEEGKPAPPAGIGLGWKIALAIWVLGFFGLILVEFGGLLWKVIARS